MIRREFISAVAVTAVAGCVGSSASGSTDGGEPTVRPTATASARETLAFGEWWSEDYFAFRVDDAEVAEEYTDERGGERRETPPKTSLLFVRLSVKNITQERRFGLSPEDFAAFHSEGSSETYGEGVPIEPERFERIGPHEAIALDEGVNSGEVREFVLAFGVPSGSSIEDVAIAFDSTKVGPRFGVRWSR